MCKASALLLTGLRLCFSKKLQFCGKFLLLLLILSSFFLLNFKLISQCYVRNYNYNFCFPLYF